MKPHIQQFLQQIRNLPAFSPKYCDNCGHKHGQEDFKFVDQQDTNIVFQISCQSCGLIYVLRVNPSVPGIMAQRVEIPNADISTQELSKFAGKPKVNKDEVLDVYEDMREVNTLGEFLELLQ